MGIFTEIKESFRLKKVFKENKEKGYEGIDLFNIMYGEVDNAEISQGTKDNILKDLKKELNINEKGE